MAAIMSQDVLEAALEDQTAWQHCNVTYDGFCVETFPNKKGAVVYYE
jgi:hypothetical protein